MNCPRCGYRGAADARFCRECELVFPVKPKPHSTVVRVDQDLARRQRALSVAPPPASRPANDRRILIPGPSQPAATAAPAAKRKIGGPWLVLLSFTAFTFFVFLGISWGTRTLATPAPPAPKSRGPLDFQKESFEVGPGGTHVVGYPNLREGAVLEGNFEASGGGGDIDFQVQRPDGTYLANVNRVTGRFGFRYQALPAGDYRLIFKNGGPGSATKTVSLNSRVLPPK